MASIQARHRRACSTGRPWTPAAERDGCDCKPTLYVVIRKGARLERIKAGKELRIAEQILTEIEAQASIERATTRAARLGRRRKRVMSIGGAYVDLRTTIAAIDALIPEAQPWARHNLKAVLADLYRAEDGIGRALREGGVA